MSELLFSWAKAPALYVKMSQVEEEDLFLDSACRAQIELKNVKVKFKLRYNKYQGSEKNLGRQPGKYGEIPKTTKNINPN